MQQQKGKLLNGQFKSMAKQSINISLLFEIYYIFQNISNFNVLNFIFSYIICMGPKKAEGEKQKQYETFLESDQYKKIIELYEDITVNMVNLHGPQDPFLSETSEDCYVNGKHQNLWDRLYELGQLMKIKPPFKKIEHEWMRSAYFGEKKKVNKDDVIYTLDGIVCQFQPQYSDAQRHIKQTVHKKVTNLIRDKEQTFDIQNYNKSRAQIKKGLQQLFGLLKTYTKKAFKVIYEQKFMEVLKPFSDLLEINMKLVLHQLKYDNEDSKIVNDFKKKAIVERYTECLENVLFILMGYHTKPITLKIKPANVFKKLQYTNLTKIQAFYLNPFTQAFNDMKKGLCALMTTGINFWKVPIQKNVKFVDHLKILVNWEIVSERHFGNQLLRDQINFVADTLINIDKANQLSKKYMLQKDPNSIQISIPKLIAFKTVQYMREYRDKQEQIRFKQQQRKRMLGVTNETKMEKQVEEKQVSFSASGTKNQFNISKNQSQLGKSKVTIKGLTLLSKDEIEEEKSKLGRYWIWENYCDDQFKNKVIEKAVDRLQHINKAVQQDIQDSIIREGMLPRKDRHDQERITAADTLKNMKTYHNADKPENMKRPPQLWNFPKVLEQQHRFRAIAEPKKCYIDGRIEQLDELLSKIGNYLMNYNKRDWNQLIRRVIDFFAGTPNQNPAFQ